MIERKLRSLESDAEAAAAAPELHHQGELLKSALGSVQPRAEQVEVKDFETGATVSIPLDPALSPTENLQRIFKRARKAERRAQKAQQQLVACRRPANALEPEAERDGAMRFAGVDEHSRAPSVGVFGDDAAVEMRQRLDHVRSRLVVQALRSVESDLHAGHRSAVDTVHVIRVGVVAEHAHVQLIGHVRMGACLLVAGVGSIGRRRVSAQRVLS